METYKGDNTLAKQIEQSRVTFSMAAKMLEKMSENQKRYYNVMTWKNSRVPNFFLFPLTKYINYF